MATSRTGTGKWKNTRIRLLAQERSRGTPCPDCGNPYEWNESRHPRSPEIDHIHPIARGGTDDLNNLRVVCRQCNQTRGAKPLRQTQHTRTERPVIQASPIW